jgi:hypothetical protein
MEPESWDAKVEQLSEIVSGLQVGAGSSERTLAAGWGA